MSAERAQALRERLLDPREAEKIGVHGTGIAAVLAPLWERAGDLVVVFIKRHGDLRLHAGQISFPGGRREPDDVDLEATALREAHEEIGLDPAAVTIVGALTPTPTVVSDIAIYPFVGLIERPASWTLAAREVETVIEASLAELAGTHRLETFQRPRGPVTTDAYTVEGQTVWGATGRIVADLLARLA